MKIAEAIAEIESDLEVLIMHVKTGNYGAAEVQSTVITDEFVRLQAVVEAGEDFVRNECDHCDAPSYCRSVERITECRIERLKDAIRKVRE